jgi:hypothetical protein
MGRALLIRTRRTKGCAPCRLCARAR